MLGLIFKPNHPRIFSSLSLLSHPPAAHKSYAFLPRSNMSTVAPDGPDWQRVSSGNVPPYWLFKKPLQKSEQDDRDYRVIQLENGLQATIVHDAKADKAAASLDVAVGHLYDPVRLQS